MVLNPKRRRKVLFVTFGLIILAIILALVAPEEKTLGSYIKLIYVHAAVTWVGMLMFVVSGVLALAALVLTPLLRNKTSRMDEARIVDWSSAAQRTAIDFWATSVIVGSIAAYFTWGSMFLQMEPRIQVALFILILGFAVSLLGEMFSARAMRAVLNLALPVSGVVLLSITGKLVHPNNAFSNSESFEIKLFAGLIAFVFLIVAINSTVIFNSRFRERCSGARPASGGRQAM
jgi:hypothetical protein